MSDRRGAWPMIAIVLVGLAWRLWLVARTPVPSEDGVNYLWMAERFAAGDYTTPLSEVFPPLLGLLMAPLSGFERGGAIALALLGALAVLPMARLCALVVGDESRTVWLHAGVLAALAGLPARYCAEIYTEPVFGLAIACAALAGVRGQPWRCGAWAGVAFWLRSEALLLPIAFALCAPRRAWRSVAMAGGAVLLLALWRHVAGFGFELMPKLEFNWQKANVGAEAATRSMFGDLLALPGAYLEAFGVAGILALLGLARTRAGRRWRPLWLTLAFALVVIVAFAVRRRFLVAWWPLLLPFALLGVEQLRARWRTPIVLVAVAFNLVIGLRTTDANRVAEREVGEWLRAQLRSGESLVTDLTRVRYFAGLRPLPPKHTSAAELIAAARTPSVRFLVLGAKRSTADRVRRALPEFVVVPLPEAIAARAQARGVEVCKKL